MIANVTNFPNATGTATAAFVGDDSGLWNDVYEVAFGNAITAFNIKYDRMPDFDILRFRGAFSTFAVTCEIWEEE